MQHTDGNTMQGEFLPQFAEGVPSHLIRFEGVPTTQDQLIGLKFVMAHCLFPDGWATPEETLRIVNEMAFDLPYQQGGGWHIIRFTAEPFSPEDTLPAPPACDFRYAGVQVIFGYTDSMTSIWRANVWLPQHPQDGCTPMIDEY